MTISMPAPLDTAAQSAGIEYGKRSVTWTIPHPGTLHRCGYDFAWIEVAETEPWVGDRLWLTATRRLPGQGISRVPFTENAVQVMRAEWLPLIARYGFDRLWIELRTERSVDAAQGADRLAHNARIDAEWWEMQAELYRLHAAGRVEVVNLPRHEQRDSTTRQRVVPGHHGAAHSESVVARLLVDGRHLGWMTDKAGLIPLAEILEARI